MVLPYCVTSPLISQILDFTASSAAASAVASRSSHSASADSVSNTRVKYVANSCSIISAFSERPHTALDKRTPDIAYFGNAETRKAA